jgi:predicted RNase H-like nuclease (RuvC/YqgF family)
MIDRSSLGAGLLALALTVAPMAPVGAQQSGSADPVPIPRDSVAAAVQQFRALQQRLEGIQQEALSESPELQQEQAAIQTAIEEGIFARRPELRESVRERIPAIEREAAAARTARDQDKLAALNDEYQDIQREVAETQTEVLEDDALQDRLTDFQATMMAAMVAVDPEIEGVLERMQVLAGRLELTIGG